METDERPLRDALARNRKAVAVRLAAAPGNARLSLLLLQDSLDRLCYMLAGDAPVTKRRAWRGEPSAVDVGALLQDAADELATALRSASAHIDDRLRASLEELLKQLAALVASLLDATRGEERAPAASPAPAGSLRVPRASAAGSAPAGAAGAAAAGETPHPELVSFSASAPAQARPGDEFVARLAAYLPDDEAKVRATLAEAAPRARLSAAPKRGGLLRGTEVEIVLEAAGLTIDGAAGRAARRFVWEGQPQIVEFDVQVPPDTAPRQVVLKFYVRLAGVVLERVLLELEIGAAQAAGAAARREAPTKRLPTTAFASYSSLDRARVLDRVAAIRIAAGIDVFLDCMDLNPSEQWEPRLRDEIDARDLFILFWSGAAAQSRWVTWEWEHALAAKGVDALQIQPLENGVNPPRALRAVHFADPYVDLRWAEVERRPPTQ